MPNRDGFADLKLMPAEDGLAAGWSHQTLNGSSNTSTSQLNERLGVSVWSDGWL